MVYGYPRYHDFICLHRLLERSQGCRASEVTYDSYRATVVDTVLEIPWLLNGYLAGCGGITGLLLEGFSRGSQDKHCYPDAVSCEDKWSMVQVPFDADISSQLSPFEGAAL